ncbi:MAG: hypothetical protein HC880_00510 [Bacteroidia bacterium]|nr:hypothetical protein [Bacteroidia bacterium]
MIRAVLPYLSRIFNDVEQSKSPEESREEILRNEYNALYPEKPLSEEDNVIDPERESEIFWKPAIDQIRRKAKGFASGIAGTVEGLGQGLISAGKTKNIGYLAPVLLIKVDGKTVSEHIGKAIADHGELMTNFYYVEEPDFTDMVAQGFGSMSTFLIPGIGIARGVNAAVAFPRIAAWLGVTASSVLEATVEGGSVYKQALENGLPEVNAADLASSVFWTNLPLLEVSNRLGIFGDIGPKVTQVIISSMMEGAQEFTQSMITNIALNDPVLQGAGQSFAIGAIVGGGTKIGVQATKALNELGDGADLMERIKSVRSAGEVLRSKKGSTINPIPEENNEGDIVRDEQGNPIEINPEEIEQNDTTTQEVPEQGQTGETEPISPQGEEGLDIGTDESADEIKFNESKTEEQKLLTFEPLLKGEGFIGLSKKQSREILKMVENLPENVSAREALKIFKSVEDKLGKSVSVSKLKNIIREQTGQNQQSKVLLKYLKEKYSTEIKAGVLENEIEKKLSGPLKATKVKKIIKENTGQVKDQGGQVSERQALRRSLRRQATAALQASRSTTKELTDVKKSIAGMIKESLPIKERGRYLTMIASAKNGRDVVKAVMRIDRDVDTFNKKETIKDIKKMFKDVKKSKNIAIDYVEKIKDLVSDVDFVKRSESALSSIKETQEYINNQISLGNNIDLPQRILNKLSILTKRPIDQVNQQDLDDLRQDIENLIEVGKMKLKTRKEIDSLRKQNDLKALATSTKAINSKTPGKVLPGEDKALFDDLMAKYEKAREFAVQHGINIAPVDVNFDILDGNQEYTGENFRIFKKRMDLLFGEFLRLKDEIQNDIKQLAHDLGLGNKDFELIGIHAAREQEGGVDKLLHTGYTQKQIDSVKLNDKQQKLYNAMREKYDELRPKIEDIMKRVYNQPLTKVKKYSPFMTDYEAMSGQEVRSMFGDDVQEIGQKNRKNVEKGFTKTRTLGKQKIKVNAMDIFLRHTENAAYLVTMGEDIKYLGELAKTEEYGKLAGNVGQKMVLDWIDLMARKGSSGENRVRIIDNLRNNVGAATLGLKLSSALIQPTALMDGAGLIGQHAFKGFSDVVSQKGVREFVLNNFPEIKHRIGDDRAFSDYDDFDGLSQIRKIGYTPLKIMDGLTAAGVGFGAYKQYLQENNIPLDLNNPNAEGIAYAQLIVRRTQSSPFFKDTAAIFNRGDAGLTGNLSLNRAILQFQSFMFNRWSLIRHDLIRLGVQEKDYKKALNIAFFLMMANFAETGLRHLSKEFVDLIATGRFDMEQYDETAGKDFAINAIQTVPYLGQALSVMEYSSNPVPTVNAVQTAIDAYDALKKSKKKATIDKNRLRVLATIGTIAGVPGSVQADQVIKMKAKKRKMKMPKS